MTAAPCASRMILRSEYRLLRTTLSLADPKILLQHVLRTDTAAVKAVPLTQHSNKGIYDVITTYIVRHLINHRVHILWANVSD